MIFNPKRAKYFITKPFGNIEFEQTLENGNVEITLTMFINLELEAAILQFGKDVIVQEPKHLRNKIAEILNEACKNYTKN